MPDSRKLGPGGAHQRLEAHARILERRGEKPAVVEAIRVMLAWRERVLTEKHGPPRDFSTPSPKPQTGDTDARTP